MAVTGIDNSYSRIYESTYAVQDHEKAGTKEVSNAVSGQQAESAGSFERAGNAGNAKCTADDSVSDYYAYLQKKYDAMSNGNISISGEYLKKCTADPVKAKELEDFLKRAPELERQGYEELSARNRALGGTVTYYQQSWIVNADGSVQGMVYSVTETGMTNAERMKKSMEERLEKQREKKAEEEKVEEEKEEQEKIEEQKEEKIEQEKIEEQKEEREEIEGQEEEKGKREKIEKPKEEKEKAEAEREGKEKPVELAGGDAKRMSAQESAGSKIAVKYIEAVSEQEAKAMMQKNRPKDAYYPKLDVSI